MRRHGFRTLPKLAHLRFTAAPGCMGNREREEQSSIREKIQHISSVDTALLTLSTRLGVSNGKRVEYATFLCAPAQF